MSKWKICRDSREFISCGVYLGGMEEDIELYLLRRLLKFLLLDVSVFTD